MWLYEFEGSNLFRQEGIPVPDYALATSPQEARQKAEEMGLPVVVKAQVLTGGRGLAGGVQVADSLDQVETVTKRILDLKIKGLPVRQVMIARKVEVAWELYVGVTVDGYNGTPVVMLSTAGGVSIEELAKTHPDQVISRPIPILKGLSLDEAQQLIREVGLDDEDVEQVSGVVYALYNLFRKYDAMVAEINPLVRTAEGTYLALDAKVEIDDESLFRHPELKESSENNLLTPLEQKGKQIGVTYVELDGDIAIIASGAGLGMATMDIVGQKLSPANFMETGGGITADLLYNTMDLVLQKEGVRAVFVNLYGGVNRMHEGAKGVVRYIQEHKINIPVVAKAVGNYQEETWKIFKWGGVTVISEVATEKGIEQLARLLEGER